MQRKKHYVSEIAGELTFEQGYFNILYSGTGTGKTEYVRTHIRDMFPKVESSEVCLITSRSMIRDQQSLKEGFRKMGYGFEPIIREWNGEEIVDPEDMPRGYIDENDLWIMNLHQFIHILDCYSVPGMRQLRNVKLVIFDEAHALYSDNFISNILAVRVWMRERLFAKDTMFVGLTATPEILLHMQKRYGIPVKIANRKPIVNYKAKHLICTTPQDVPLLFAGNRLPGKSIVLCPTVGQCRQMQKEIPNSEVLCSQNNKGFTHRMQHIREYILRHETLPSVVGDIDSSDKENKSPINVLIVTTTMREGINLCEASDIRNVVCCMPDSMNTVQFAGRCRKDIDNLVVAGKLSEEEEDEEDFGGFLHDQNSLFRAFAQDRTDKRWYAGIAHIVEEGFENVEWFRYTGDTEGFRKAFETEYSGRKFCKEQDGDALCALARQYEIFGTSDKKYTYLHVLRALQKDFGYTFEEKKVKGKRYKVLAETERKEEERKDDAL